MAKTRKDKEQMVEDLKEKFQRASCIVFAEYQMPEKGLTVEEATELRKQFREANAEFKVVKNRLAKIALEADNLEYNPEFMAGPTAIGISFEDPVAAAKLLNDYSKKHEMLKLRGAILDGKLLDIDSVKALAELPSRDELLSTVMRTMQAPISGTVNVLAGTIRGFVTVLERIKEQKEEAAA
jgi:large subunit ribosomal protein L10